MDELDDLPDQTLSFVDVITNGLGSLLILFFIMIVTQETLHWSRDREAPPTPLAPTDRPMMILVTIKPGRTGFDTTNKQSPWLFKPIASDLGLATERGRDWDWGKDYALLISPSPLPGNAQIGLNTPLLPNDVVVEIYAQGKKYTVPAERADGLLRVWPATLENEQPEVPTKP